MPTIAIACASATAATDRQHPKALTRMTRVVDDVRHGFACLGWQSDLLSLPSDPLGLLAAAARLRDYDAVFNLTEYLGGDAAGEERATALLELVGRPLTGNPSRVLSICRSKSVTRALLAEAGIPI